MRGNKHKQFNDHTKMCWLDEKIFHYSKFTIENNLLVWKVLTPEVQFIFILKPRVAKTLNRLKTKIIGI